MQRSVFYETKYIPKNERLTEEEFDKKINSLVPYLLDQCFNTLSNTLNIFDGVKKEITSKERMADFIVFGECISRSLGFDNFEFLEAYKQNLDSNSLGASDTWPIIDIVLDLFKNKKTPFDITIDELYNQSVQVADSKNIDRKSRLSRFPKTKSKLSGQLTRFSESFRNSGYLISSHRYNSRDNKFKRGSLILKIASSTPNQSRLESKVDVSTCQRVTSENQAQNDPNIDTSTKNGARVNVSPNKSDKNDKKSSKTDTSTDTDKSKKNSMHVSQNSKSSHKKEGWHADTSDTCTLPTSDKKIKNKKSVTKNDKNSSDNRSKKYTHFKCTTCNAGEFGIDERGINKESILNFHKKLGHSIQYFDQKEARTKS